MTGSYPTLYVHTREIADPGDLLTLIPGDLPAGDVMAWVREEEGIVAWGRAASTLTFGEERFADAETWFNTLTQNAQVDDEVGVSASGLVAFGSFSFRNSSAEGATLVIPSVLVARREGRAWMTTCTLENTHHSLHEPVSAAPARPPHDITVDTGALAPVQWGESVNESLRMIRNGRVSKVVLARDEVHSAHSDIDPRWPLARLATAYAQTWTFAVDGLIGATPEMLVRTHEGDVFSRILAGTIRHTGAASTLAHQLAHSAKDLHEHAFAVRSVEAALAPHCDDLVIPQTPFVLELPNVLHLATDIHGHLADEATSLSLAAALHPSAAVCGTPTLEAAHVIDELEHMDRGRYAGPVGWMDAHGNGEWGIALRCGRIESENPSRIRLFAGCGIVEGSDAQSEIAESIAKLAPMRYALGEQ